MSQQKEVLVPASLMERIAHENPGLVITLTAERAYCTHRGVTMYAVLPSIGRAS